MVDMSLKPGEGKSKKLIRDALLAAERNDPERLKKLAERWWDRALDDQQAANALADRLDGKAVQPISGSSEDDPISIIARIERVVTDPNG